MIIKFLKEQNLAATGMRRVKLPGLVLNDHEFVFSHFACYINNLLVLVLMAASSGTSSSVDPVWSLIQMTLTPPTSK